MIVAKYLHKQNLNVWKESHLYRSWLDQSYCSNISQIVKDSEVFLRIFNILKISFSNISQIVKDSEVHFNFTTNTGNVSLSKQINTFDELDCDDEIDGYKLCALG